LTLPEGSYAPKDYMSKEEDKKFVSSSSFR
jgi:hypothetical protein